MYIYIYINIFYFICIYQYFLCLHSLYSYSATRNTYLSLHLPLLSTFFSCSSYLVSKISEMRPQIFICTTKMNELGLRRSLNDDTRDPSLYAFHFSHLIPHITCTCEKSWKLVKDPCRIRTRRKTHFKLYVIESFAYYETKLKILI